MNLLGDELQNERSVNAFKPSIANPFSLALASAALLSACANSPVMLQRATPAELQAAPTQKVCAAWRQNGADSELSEIKRRSVFSAEDMGAIENHAIRVGMTGEAALCSWGDAYIRGPGIDDPAVEKRVFWHSKAFIFLRNGVVTSFQN